MSETYNVTEIFYSIQGEGTMAGVPMTFIRLSGCNLTCSWCDTKYSWKPGKVMTLGEIAREVGKHPLAMVCITGGEPFLQDLHDLCHGLRQIGMVIQIESNGTCIPESWDEHAYDSYLVISPKRQSPPSYFAYSLADEIKIVIAKEDDLRWLEAVERALGYADQEKVIQPEGNRPETTKLCLDYVKEHPQWRLSLQLHKILQIQ